jgi:glyoxylase-like metal-dependent hydrolase (beta-lactamase superfamily II)
MEIKQIKLARMAVFCYLIGDESTKTCAAIDPAFDTDHIISEAQRRNYRITHIINTHGHSDHTAGNQALKAATGARLLIHELDAERLGKVMHKTFSRMLGGKGSPRPDVLLHDEDLVRIGASQLKVLHTPGHTPGSICLYADGHLFTGDTLFVGAVGRIDLPGGSRLQLRMSFREKILTLPGETIVWPGHDYGPTSTSTIAQEQDTNPFIP